MLTTGSLCDEVAVFFLFSISKTFRLVQSYKKLSINDSIARVREKQLRALRDLDQVLPSDQTEGLCEGQLMGVIYTGKKKGKNHPGVIPHCGKKTTLCCINFAIMLSVFTH